MTPLCLARNLSLALLALSCTSCRKAQPPPAGRRPIAAPTGPTPAQPAPPSTSLTPDPNRPAWARDPFEDPFQPAEVEGAFNTANGAIGALRSGVVLCRAVASMQRQWDTAVIALFTVGLVDHTAPDITFALRVSDEPERVSSWRDDSHVGFGAFSGITMQPGARLTLRLEDRDTVLRMVDQVVLRSDAMGAATAVWSGSWPLLFRGDLFTAECRAVSGDDATTRARQSLATFDREVATASRRRERGAELGAEIYPASRFARVRTALRSAAGWVGWSDPEVRARVAASNVLDAQAMESVTRAIARADAADIGEAQRARQGTVNLTRWSCEESFTRSFDANQPPTCVALVEVAVRPDGEAQHGNLTRVTLHAPFDHPVSLSRCWMSADGRAWAAPCEAAPGQTVTFAFGVDEALPVARAPWSVPSVLDVSLFFERSPARFRLAR